jgi:ribosomal protein S10
VIWKKFGFKNRWKDKDSKIESMNIGFLFYNMKLKSFDREKEEGHWRKIVRIWKSQSLEVNGNRSLEVRVW